MLARRRLHVHPVATVCGVEAAAVIVVNVDRKAVRICPADDIAAGCIEPIHRGRHACGVFKRAVDDQVWPCGDKVIAREGVIAPIAAKCVSAAAAKGYVIALADINLIIARFAMHGVITIIGPDRVVACA